MRLSQGRERVRRRRDRGAEILIDAAIDRASRESRRQTERSASRHPGGIGKIRGRRRRFRPSR